MDDPNIEFRKNGYIEGYAKKMTLTFYFIAFSNKIIMLLLICVLKVHTLTIPKW